MRPEALEALAQALPSEAELVACAQAFVALPSPTGQEAALAQAFAQRLREAGAELLAAPDAAGNVLAALPGDRTAPALLLLVPLDNEAPWGQPEGWAHPPLAGVVAEGRLHGAGLAHHKAAMASLVGMVRCLAAQPGQRGNVLVAGLAGGGHRAHVGMRHLVDVTLLALGLHADLAVMCQGSGLEVVLSHRGRVELEIALLGRVANAATPWMGINAASMSRWVLEELEALSAHLPTHPHMDRASLAVVGVASGPDAWGRVPDRCLLRLERHFLPSEGLDAVVMQIQSVLNRVVAAHPECRAELSLRALALPGGAQVARVMQPLAGEASHALIRQAVEGIRASGLVAPYGRWTFTSEVGHWAAVKGGTAFGFGPGEELLANTPQDSVSVAELRQAALAYAALAWRIAGA